MKRLRASLLLLGAGLATGCTGQLPEILLELRTDYIASVEFDATRAQLGERTAVDRVVDLGADYIGGVRIAAWPSLEPGVYEIEVELLSDGRIIARRPLVVTVTAPTSVTAVLSRSCSGVVCPRADATLTACMSGVCVDPSCTVETNAVDANPVEIDGGTGGCGPPECTTDDECPAGVACATPVCAQGVCLLATNDSACAAPQFCHPEMNCIDAVSPVESVCGDAACGGSESCMSCPADCGACTGACGDGICQASETCISCLADCGGCPSGCGDGSCSATETCDSCSMDCGVCPAGCGDSSCGVGETCDNCPDDCGSCPPMCGDGSCNGGETCGGCPGDCGSCPPTCGDGSCNGGETCGGCPGDCGACPPTCGDGSCDGGETCGSCPGDCVGHLGSGTSGDSCAGIANNTWRCAIDPTWGPVTQKCNGSIWQTFTLDPVDCASCVCGFSGACCDTGFTNPGC